MVLECQGPCHFVYLGGEVVADLVYWVLHGVSFEGFYGGLGGYGGGVLVVLGVSSFGLFLVAE